MVPTIPKPIETRYKGYRFRSRLEAGLTNSAEQPIRCGTFSGMAVRGVKAQFEQANRYLDISNRLMECYVGLFANCAWVDEESAICKLVAEIKTLRHEKESLEETLSELRRMDQMRDA